MGTIVAMDVLQAKQAHEQAIAEFGADHFAPHLREELSRRVVSEARKWIKYQRSDLVDEAVAAFELALQLAPDSPLSSRDWAHLCWQGSVLGRAEEVLFAGDRAVEAAPDDPQAYEARGLARALTGNIDGAKADCNSAVLHCNRLCVGLIAPTGHHLARIPNLIKSKSDLFSFCTFP